MFILRACTRDPMSHRQFDPAHHPADRVHTRMTAQTAADLVHANVRRFYWDTLKACTALGVVICRAANEPSAVRLLAEPHVGTASSSTTITE